MEHLIFVIGIAFYSIFVAICDKLQHHHSRSIFRKADAFSFWGKDSWVRKWKYNNPGYGKEKFFLSTTMLVWLTDAWHLFKTLQILTIFTVAVVGVPFTYEMAWYYKIGEVALCAALYGGIFELFYSFILSRK